MVKCLAQFNFLLFLIGVTSGLSGVAYAGPTVDKLVQQFSSGDPVQVRRAVETFTQADDPVRFPEAHRAVVDFLSAERFGPTWTTRTKLMTHLFENEAQILDEATWTRLAQGIFRHDARGMISMEICAEWPQRNSPISFKNLLARTMTDEIRSGRVTPGLHKRLMVESFFYSESPLLKMTRIKSQEVADLRQILAVDSEESFRRVFNDAQAKALDVNEHGFDYLLLVLSNAKEDKMPEVLQLLREKGVIEAFGHRMAILGRWELEPHFGEPLKKIYQVQFSAPIDYADLFNWEMAHSSGSAEWIIPASLLRLTGFPDNDVISRKILTTPSPDLVRIGAKIKLSPKMMDVAFPFLPLSVALAELRNPDSPFYDRLDLFQHYVRNEQRHVSGSGRGAGIPLNEVLGKPHPEGVFLPPKIAEWVGSLRLSEARLLKLEERESLGALLQSAEGRTALTQKLKSPKELTRAVLSQNPHLREFLIRGDYLARPEILGRPELIEQLILDGDSALIAKGRWDVQKRHEQLASSLAPLFKEGQPWRHHPELIRGKKSVVTAEDAIAFFLTSKTSLISPASPHRARFGCLAGIWEGLKAL